MSAPTAKATLTIQERSAEATRRLTQVLNLSGLSVADLKYLSAAVAEAAANEAAINVSFAARIHSLFEEMLPPKKATPVKKTTSSQRPKRKSIAEVVADDGLVPIADNVDHRFDPYAPPDPQYLLRLYGSDQLFKALERYPVGTLKETIAELKKENPNIKSKASAKKEELIDLIITQVVR